MSKKINEKNILVMSCVVSYILLSLVSILKLKVKHLELLPNTSLINSALSLLIGTCAVILISIISQRRLFKKITVKLFHKTFNDDIWRDVLDLDKGSNLKVYLKGKNYYLIGHHKNHEEKGNDSWLALSAFAKFDINTNKNFNNEPSYLNRNDIYIVIRFSDIEHIEIF